MQILDILPTRLISYLFGKLVRIKWPWPLNLISVRIYMLLTGSSLHEASKDKYSSIAEFFVRDFKPETRQLGSGFVSPCDARLRTIHEVSSGIYFRVKNFDYDLASFFIDESVADLFEGGLCINTYLSPSDFHHVYAPFTGQVSELLYVPGRLLPVNNFAMNSVNNLFSVNERCMLIFKSEFGMFCVAMIAAFNVGGIELHLGEEKSFISEFSEVEEHSGYRRIKIDEQKIEKGNKIGSFHLGSAVLVFVDSELRTNMQEIQVKEQEKLKALETIIQLP